MTLFISDKEKRGKQALKTAFVYFLAALFCAFFGGVYEIFSHEVYSYYMIYAFAFPLLGGTLPYMLLALREAEYPGAMCAMMQHCGIATLTVGSVIRGILDIYGTTNALSAYYWYVGAALVLGSGLCVLCRKKQERDFIE